MTTNSPIKEPLIHEAFRKKQLFRSDIIAGGVITLITAISLFFVENGSSLWQFFTAYFIVLIIVYVIRNSNSHVAIGHIWLSLIAVCLISVIYQDLRFESLFCIPISIGAFLYIKSTLHAKSIFFTIVTIGCVIQITEFLTIADLGIPQESGLINTIVITSAIGYSIMRIYLLNAVIKVKISDSNKWQNLYEAKELEFKKLVADTASQLSMTNDNNSLGNNDQIDHNTIDYQELLHTQIVYNAIIRNSQDGIVAINPDRKVIAINPVAQETIQKFLGVPIELGMDLLDYATPEFRNRYSRAFDLSLAGESLHIQNDSLLNKDQFLDVTFQPLKSNNSELIGVLIMYRDITSLKQKENQIALSEKKYKTIIDAIPGGIAIINLDTIIDYVSTVTANAFGYVPEEITGTSILQYFDEISQQNLLDYSSKLQQGLSPSMITLKGITKDGSEFYIEGKGRVIQNDEEEDPYVIGVFIDSTESTFAKEKLIEREATLDAILNSTKDCILAYDTDYNILAYNECWLKNSKGIAIKEVHPKSNLKEILPKEIFDTLHKNTLIALQTGEMVYQKRDLVKPDGYLDLKTVPLINNKGEKTGLLEIMRDITKEKNQEHEIIESRRIFKSIFDKSLVGITTSKRGKFTSANPFLCDLVGYSEDELIGKSVFSIVSEDNQESLKIEIKKMVNFEIKTINKVLQLIHKNGSIKKVLTRVIGEYDKSNKYISDISTITDITQLIEREATLQAIIESSPDSIFSLNLDSEIVVMNEKTRNDFKNYIGKTVKFGDSFNSSFCDSSKFSEWQSKNITRSLNGSIVQDSINIDFNDTSLSFESYFAPIRDVTNSILGSVIYTRDVTLVRKNQDIIERQLKELEKYIESNLQLENFAYIASHDLKAPLRTVNSFAFLLKSRIYEASDEKSKEYIDIICDSSRNMQILIDDLLTFSQINTQKLELRELSLHKIINNCLHQLQLDITKNNAQIILDDDLPDLIVADNIKFNQLLLNLISNAIKFSKTDKSPIINISGTSKEDHWQFSIKDNGIGMDEIYHEEIFTIFKKLHSVDKYGGTGLGLTICTKIVEQHKGEIWVDSSIAEGSTFHFTISKLL